MPVDADEDRMKLKFTLDAMKSEDPFAHTTKVPDCVSDAINWHAERSPQEIMQFQDDLMSKLEDATSKMWLVIIFFFCTVCVHVSCLAGHLVPVTNGLVIVTPR